MHKIISKFNESLIIESTDIISDYIELGIDNILDNEILKEIPVVKSLVSAGKIASTIREKHMMKKLKIFIVELNAKKIDRKN